MHYHLIIKNGILVTHLRTYKADVAIRDGIICRTGDLHHNDTADDIYDAEGKHILPGIIDAHVHFRDPGLTEKEDFETGSVAAAFGGVTTVADMPNVIPVTSTAQNLKEKIKIAQKKSYVDFALFALLTNDNLDEMEKLKKLGALGFKVFFGTSTGDIACPSAGILIQQMEKSVKLNLRIGFHCETSEINSYFTSVCKNKTNLSDGKLLSQARPVMSEALAVQTVIYYNEYAKAKIHIHHITSDRGLSLIAQAKQKKMDISTEVCPHYLLFVDTQDAHKVYPPIRGQEDNKALWQALKRGEINFIASDHAPHTKEEKALPLWDAPAGICGVETTVPLMLNEVNKGNLSLNDFVRFSSEAPARIWDIYPQKGNLRDGADADITIVDMNMKKVIRASELHSKSKTTPYEGMEVQGCPVSTLVRGKFVVKDGKLTGVKGHGIHVKPKCLR
ncbi:allantoinase [Treponema sp. R8-4-B8]